MDFVIELDRNAAKPLHQQLYEEVRQAILGGRLLPRQRLPSTRSLAKSLGISRITVTQSYEQLLSEGYLQTLVGSGTFVSDRLPDELLRSTPIESKQTVVRSPINLSGYASNVAATKTLSMSEEISLPISFRYGRPAFDQFPIKLWRKLFSRRCLESMAWMDYATDVLGYKPLRHSISRYLARARAVQCEADRVLITNGTQQSLYLITRLLINPGEIVALEEPGNLAARKIFLSQKAKLLPISVDGSGLIVQELANYSNEFIKLVVVTPSHQFPTGATLSLPRRLELLAWAQKTGSIIVEDDYDSEYRYGDRPLPALQGMDRSNSVFYMGSFSKVLFPSLRIGYLILPPNLVSLFASAKWLCDRQIPLLDQQILTDFIEEGHFERHIRRMRSHYNYCRQALVQALNNYFGEKATILGEKAGIHLMVKLHINLSDDAIIQRAKEVGIELVPAEPHYLKTFPGGEFIFGYAELTEQQLQEGIHKLAQVLL